MNLHKIMFKQLAKYLGKVYRNIAVSGISLGIAVILPSDRNIQILYVITEFAKICSYVLASVASIFAIVLTFKKIKIIKISKKDEKVDNNAIS